MILAASDPFQPYTQHDPKGKGPPHSVIPEGTTTGAILIGLCLGILLLKRWHTRRGGLTCCGKGGCHHG